MVYRSILVACMVAALPLSAQAAVIFSEIAWMGSATDANDEWIEIYNFSNEPADVTGWTVSDGNSLSIELLGVMPPHGLFLLERTDDTSVPGVAADIIYTGSLVNTGATLTLKDAQGNLMDQVAGGENWEAIGGDNTTKDTAQLTRAGGWVTAAPTPGADNAIEATHPTEEEEEESDTDTTSRSTTQSKAPASVKNRTLSLPDNELAVSLSKPAVVYVNHPVSLSAVPSGVGKVIMDSLQYQWNFGDLSTTTGKTVSHTYQHPGEYLVTVRAAYARHETISQTSITVLPVRFSMTTDPAGNLQIHNDAKYDIDVSGYIISGNDTVVFPEFSYIPAGGTVTVPPERFGGFRQGQAFLRDTTHAPIAWLNSKYETAPVLAREMPSIVSVSSIPSAPLTKSSAAPLAAEFSFATSAKKESTDEEPSLGRADTPQPLMAAAVTGEVSSERPFIEWPLVGLIALMFFGLLGIVVVKKPQ